MTPTQLELTRLLGSKKLSFGCFVKWTDMQEKEQTTKFCAKVYAGQNMVTYVSRYSETGEESLTVIGDGFAIIGHPATLTDLHRWMNDNGILFVQYSDSIDLWNLDKTPILYDSSKPLLDQEEATLSAILNLVKTNE